MFFFCWDCVFDELYYVDLYIVVYGVDYYVKVGVGFVFVVVGVDK